MTGLRTITFTAADLDDLADQFARMSELKATEAKRTSRPARNRHDDEASARAYAKAEEMVRALATPARPRSALRVVTNDGVA